MHDLNEYRECKLCAHNCGVNREIEYGKCRMPDKLKISRAALHMWEEPIISGNAGSGTIFFSGCSLGCVYCQNREISRGLCGAEVSIERLSDIMLSLQSQGAHNINLVTPTHYVPSIKKALIKAKADGLSLPIVYNTASFDNSDTLKSLEGLVDIYIPDLKYHKEKTAKELSFAEVYPSAARAAISEMVRQRQKPVIEDGIMSEGVVARILLLPAHVAEAKLSLKYLLDTYGDSIYISLMCQYTPMSGMKAPLNRRVTHAEYEDLLAYADKIGLKNGFVQELSSAKESYIPSFDYTGVE